MFKTFAHRQMQMEEPCGLGCSIPQQLCKPVHSLRPPRRSHPPALRAGHRAGPALAVGGTGTGGAGPGTRRQARPGLPQQMPSRQQQQQRATQAGLYPSTNGKGFTWNSIQGPEQSHRHWGPSRLSPSPSVWAASTTHNCRHSGPHLVYIGLWRTRQRPQGPVYRTPACTSSTSCDS